MNYTIGHEKLINLSAMTEDSLKAWSEFQKQYFEDVHRAYGISTDQSEQFYDEH